MAEQQPNPPGPDLTKGVSAADIAAGPCSSDTSTRMPCCLRGRVTNSLRSARHVRTIADRSRKARWPATRSAVPGTTRVSACERARRSGLLRSMHCRVGAWKRATTKYLYAKGRPRPIEASRPNQRGPRPSRIASSSWAAVPRDLLPPRCCGAKDLAAVSRSYPLTMSRPTTGRIAPRITWPEARRKTGCRSSRLSSTRNIQLTFSSAARLPQ